MTQILEKLKMFWGKIASGWEKVKPVFEKIKSVIGVICKWLYRLRKMFLAAPVVYFAIRFARENLQRLPETVGINLQSSGEFAYYVSRNYAVYGPLGVTAFCLLLMLCSRKALFPWIISILTLTLPFLIRLLNIYSA